MSAGKVSVAGRRVLVTGATGFIGGALCRRLAGLGAEVHGLSRGAPEPSPAVTWHWGDLGEPSTARRLLGEVQPEVVFHLASCVLGSRSLDAVPTTFHANLASTVHLLTAAQELGCGRVVLAGSLEEPEDPGSVPASPYAAAKGAASAYARMFHALYGTPVVTARLFMVYGPGQKDLKKLVPYVTLSLLRGETPELTSGRREVDWIYVDDVVEGLLAMASAPGLEGRRIDLGSGELVTVRGVVERLGRIVGGPTPSFGALDDRPMEQVRVADAGEAARVLGWRPRASLEEGLRRTVEWYREHNLEE